jgi:hypothetical protein
MTPATVRRLAGALLLLLPHAARADYHLVSPYEIDLGELEIEHNGAAAFDGRRDIGGAQSYTTEFGTGLTPWWHSEIEFGFDREPGFGQPTLLTQVVTENMFQLTEPGEQFADLGLFVEYGQSLTSARYAASNQVTFGPVIAKDIGRTTTMLNLFFTRLFGPNQTTHGLDFTFAAQTRWNIWEPLSPAVEVYGDTGVIGDSPAFSKQELLAGPVAIGDLKFAQLGWGPAGKIKYELGWLFGATPSSAAGTLRWRLEAEVPF